METFKYILIGLIISTVYVLIIKHFIKDKDTYNVDDKTINRVISISQLHIIFIFCSIGFINSLNPFEESNAFNSILDNTFLGSLYDFFSDERPAPNPYVVEAVDNIKQNKNVFVFIGLALCAIESLGLIDRKINRRTIEIINIITSICICFYLNKLCNTFQSMMSQSTIEGIANNFGQSFNGTLSWIGMLFMIAFIALGINHILAHKALEKYYTTEIIQEIKETSRSSNQILAGVCANLAEYFGWNVTIVRIVYAFFTFFTVFFGIAIYLILWIVMNKKNAQ